MRLILWNRFWFVFNWDHFEMRLLNLRINFFIYCDRQQLWKAVITGDTVTRLSIPIRGRGKNHLKKAVGEIWPKRSERKKKQKTKKKNYRDKDKK